MTRPTDAHDANWALAVLSEMGCTYTVRFGQLPGWGEIRGVECVMSHPEGLIDGRGMTLPKAVEACLKKKSSCVKLKNYGILN